VSEEILSQIDKFWEATKLASQNYLLVSVAETPEFNKNFYSTTAKQKAFTMV
jgi:hypothetical protein